MKILFSLIALVSLVMGQFASPLGAVNAQSADPTATASQTETVTETPTVEPTTPPVEEPTESTATATPTSSIETPTASPTAVVTETPSSTGTVPAAQTPTTTATSTPHSPVLTLRLTPDFSTPNGKITVHWEITGILSDHDELSLVFTFPDGVQPELPQDAVFNEQTNTLTFPVTNDRGRFDITAQNILENTFITAVLYNGNDRLTESSILLSIKEQFEVTSAGGEISAKGGKIKIKIPADTFSTDTVIEVGDPTGDAIPPYSLSGGPVEIKARDKQNKTDLHLFDKEIEIQVSYAQLGISEEVEGDLHLHWYNPETQEWDILPTSVHKESKTLRGFTNHFSVFDIDFSHWQASHLPTIDSFQVSNFTGAATYSLPIEVPPGPGGFQPSLSLNYNSQVVDQSTTHTQASWVGMGWSLETGSIELDDSRRSDWSDDDTHLLNVAGVSTRIVQDPNGAYHAADENFWKIEHPNTDVWTVKDKQGNTYTFELKASIPFGLDDPDCADRSWKPSWWWLTKVENVFGQQILYEYDVETKPIRFCDGENPHPQATTAVYPSEITYARASETANPKYRIRFVRGDRQDYKLSWNDDLVYNTYQRQRLLKIYVEQNIDAEVNGVFETVLRRYDFSYANPSDTDVIFPGVEWTAGGKTTTLRSVRQHGVGATAALPTTTFTYTDKLHLTRAENGYGGAVEFDYGLWYYAADARPSFTVEVDFGLPGRPCFGNAEAPWTARAGSVDCGDEDQDPLHIRGPLGIATAGSIQNHQSSPYGINQSKDLVRPGGVYKVTAGLGITDVSVRLGLDYGTAVNDDEWHITPITASGTHTRYITLPAEASKVEPLVEETGGNNSTNPALEKNARLGYYKLQLLTSIYRVTTKRVQNGNGHTYEFSYSYKNDANVDSAAVNDEVTSPDGVCGTECMEYFEKFSEFRGHAQVTETGPDGKKTVTKFHQDDILKGRPISVIIKDGYFKNFSQINYSYTSVSLPMTGRSYCVICSAYVGLGRYFVYTNAEENRIYSSNGTSYNATRSVYTYETTYGNLRTQTDQSWNGSAWLNYRSKEIAYYPNNTGNTYLVGLPGYENIFDANHVFLGQTLFFYDNHLNYSDLPTYGKLTDMRTWTGSLGYSHVEYGFDDWGNRTSVTTYSGYGTGTTNTPPTGPRTTTTVYDPIFHAYPISETTPPTTSVPAGLTTTWMYDYDHNGINDYILGVPTLETDSNGNETEAWYDSFGRITHLVRPGHDDAYPNPTIKIAYFDTIPFHAEIRQKIDTTRYVIVHRFYDGIGRPTKIEYGTANSATAASVLDNTVSYSYPSFGTVWQSMPYAAGETPAYTKTISDVLGRPKSVEAPGSLFTNYTYDGLSTAVTDPRGNTIETLSDAWGRVESVTPSIGPSVTYTYDEFDRLKSATRGGSTTTLTYDGAGRKISMSDPDMGNWTYTYDALGNLTRQKDARGKRICLYYDLLNRLTAKQYRTDDSCPATQPVAPDVLFTYDTGINGKGHRTYAENDGIISLWTYDERGRLKTETVMDRVTTWSYNSADLPLKMVYPGLEEVNYEYNNQMLLESLTGTDPYVTSSTYDEAGRLDERTLGNGLIQDYDYYDWDEKAAVNGPQMGQGGRLKNLNIGSLQDLSYVYDQVGNVRTITDSIDGETQAFRYGALDRLTSATVTGGPASYTEKYTYDASTGNLATKASSANQAADNPGLTGLVAWWTMDEISGMRKDSSYENHLTDINTVGSTTGRKGKAADFVTANLEHLTVADNGLLSGGDVDFTLVANVYLDNNANTFVIMDKSDAASAYDYRLAHQAGTGFRFRVSASAYVDSGAVTANAWHTVIAWHDSVNDTINIQVDNGMVNSVPFSGGTMDTANPLTLGAFANGTMGLDGRLDEVAIYKRVLTSNQRAWLHNSGLGRSYEEVANPVTYTYDTSTTDGDPAHPHAVASLSNNNGYKYDANGNQIKRVIGTDTYDLIYDEENRLDEVKKNNVLIAKFYYDADGKRVKSVMGSETTLFIGAHYQVTNPDTPQKVITKYYLAGSQRIAMRVGNTLTYLHSDHLGSTSLTTDWQGNKISEVRYKAWGEVRYAWGNVPTKYQYTGQFSYEQEFGLYFYNARWYDSALGRFAQADTIIPQNQGVQAWDRYAYTNNNPLRYTDPTGHCISISNCLQKIQQMGVATQFLVGRMLEKGEINLTKEDWEGAANYAAPAVASGSKESVTWTVGEFITVVKSTTVITTDEGDIQVFDESNLNNPKGIPEGVGLPGASASVTHGLVYGLDGDALNYRGDAVQLTAGIPATLVGGLTAEAYVSPEFNVGGVDVGVYVGFGPTIISGAKTNADPNGHGKISSLLKQVLPDRVDGFGLFVCRMASMCGAR